MGIKEAVREILAEEKSVAFVKNLLASAKTLGIDDKKIASLAEVNLAFVRKVKKEMKLSWN